MIIRYTGFSPSSLDNNLPVIGYVNYVTASNIETNTANPDFPVTNIANAATHLIWKSGVNTGDERLIFHINGATIDYVGVVGHNWAGRTVTISVTSDTGSPYDTPGFTTVVQATVIADNRPLIFQFIPQAVQTLLINITSDTDTFRQAAVVYVGLLLTLERSVKVDVDVSPVQLNRVNDIVNGMSESGNFLGRVLSSQKNEMKLDFSFFTNSWYRANFDPFALAARDKPFFIAWAPNNYPTDVGYCWLTKDVVPRLNIHNRLSATLEMRGIA